MIYVYTYSTVGELFTKGVWWNRRRVKFNSNEIYIKQLYEKLQQPISNDEISPARDTGLFFSIAAASMQTFAICFENKPHFITVRETAKNRFYRAVIAHWMAVCFLFSPSYKLSMLAALLLLYCIAIVAYTIYTFRIFAFTRLHCILFCSTIGFLNALFDSLRGWQV